MEAPPAPSFVPLATSLSPNTGTGVYTRTLTDGTKYTFDSSGKQTSIVDRNGSTTTFSYSGSNLTGITDPYGLLTTLTDTGSQVTSIQDPANRLITLSYDSSNRLTSITDPGGALWQYGYDSTNHLTTLTNPRSFTTTFSYNAAGRVCTVTGPDSSSEQLSALVMQGPALSTPGISVVQSAGSPAPSAYWPGLPDDLPHGHSSISPK